MTEHVEGTFTVTSWSEEPSSGLEGTVKVTTARIGQRFDGGAQADTVADLVMTYRADGTADFAGHQRLAGTVNGRSGSLVLRGLGTFDGAEARTMLEVIPGSGTGELAGARGHGVTTAPLGSTGSYSLDLEW